MPSRTIRLDRFISKETNTPIKAVKPLLAAGRIYVNDEVERASNRILTPFDSVRFDKTLLRTAKAPIYLMMHKPAGVVSATRDADHPTVMDLIRNTEFADCIDDLHLAGRLDITSTGLILLTNDSAWSESLTLPGEKLPKRYWVSIEKPLTEKDLEIFQSGMFFEYENRKTNPVMVRNLSASTIEMTLTDGMYHQIRRMLARRQNKALAIHRVSIGDIVLPDDLMPGEVRALSSKPPRA